MKMKLTNRFPRFYSAVIFTVLISCLTYSAMAIEQSLKSGVLLHQKIGGHSSGSKPNFVFSPMSIFSVFHAAQTGAAGETRAQMDALVGPEEKFNLPAIAGNEGVPYAQVDVANKIYLDKSLTNAPEFQTFKDKLAAKGASADNLDFGNPSEAASHINGFVAEVTRDHIKELVEEGDLVQGTKMVLVNALYFKGPWHTQFSHAATHQGTFFAPSGPTEVSYMTGKVQNIPAIHYAEDGLQTAGIPYKDTRLRMYIFMPEDIDHFESRIVAEPYLLEAIVSNMEKSEKMMGWQEELQITLPKFKLSALDNKVDLVSLFKEMGAEDMFDAQKADFSNITGGRELHVSSYMHQADIIVDEEGTEATAATAMAMMIRSAMIGKKTVNVLINKPFIFQIRYVPDVGTTAPPQVLFSGRIANPASAQ